MEKRSNGGEENKRELLVRYPLQIQHWEICLPVLGLLSCRPEWQ